MKTMMKNSIHTILTAFVVFGLVNVASAKTAPKNDAQGKFKYLTPVTTTTAKPKTTRAKSSSKKLSRDVVFDGSVVNGKYLSAGEAVSTVESEKTLNDLIGMRGDFKDRLTAEKQRLKSGK